MNYVNKVVTILVFLVLIGISIGATLIMYGVELNFLGSYFSQAIDYLTTLERWQLAVGTAAAVLVILVALFFIFLEIQVPAKVKDFLITSF